MFPLISDIYPHLPPPLLPSGWHLDHVEVTDEATGVLSYFPCGMWFDKVGLQLRSYAPLDYKCVKLFS